VPITAAADETVAGVVRAWVAEHWPRDAAAAGDLHERLVGIVETALAHEALEQAGGNRTAAARLLGVDRATLRAKLER
jgi:two-component system response regulator HydG